MTTPYHVKISPTAQKQIRALSPKLQKPLIQLLEALAINPRPPGAEKMEGMTGLYREHLLYLRLVYKIEEQEVLVLLVK